MLDVLIYQPEEKPGPAGIRKISDRADKPIKSVLKAVSWRIVGTIDTMVISYFITGKVSMALTIGSVEVLTKTILYYFHERIWAHIHKLRFNIFKKQNGRRFKINRAKIVAQRKNNRGIAEDLHNTLPGRDYIYN